MPEFLELELSKSVGLLGEVEVRRTGSLAERMPLRAINRGAVYCDGIRLKWNDEVTFDMFEGERIDYVPGQRWRSSLPSSFYSTIAALTLAWRGAVPLHACSIEVDGRAFLIAGPTGAGKSSLAAGLIGLGATLVADDLTVARVDGEHGPIHVFPGRPAMRQHPATAAQLDAEVCVPIAGDGRGKWLVRPTARTSQSELPLGGILLLDSGDLASGAPSRLALLARHLFRPRWMAALPNYAALRRDLLTIASTVPIRLFPPVGLVERVDRGRRAEQAMATLRAMLTPAGTIP